MKKQKNSSLKNGKIAMMFGGDIERCRTLCGNDWRADSESFTDGSCVFHYQHGTPSLTVVYYNANLMPVYDESQIMTEAEEAHEVKRFKEKLMATLYLIVGMAFIGLGWLIAKGCAS